LDAILCRFAYAGSEFFSKTGSVKGTGFSPYIALSKMIMGFSAGRENLARMQDSPTA
jgi:hypothetical protein